VFLITACGSLLAYASGTLPQWRQDKWNARILWAKKTVAVTQGNDVVVVVGEEGDLDLEDSAAAWPVPLWSTRVYTFLLAICWLVLLIASTGIKTGTWYLLAVGVIGMLQNFVVASAARYPASMGFPIELAKMLAQTTASGDETGVDYAVDGQKPEVSTIFAEEKIMLTLMEFDERFKGLGKPLMSEFFPRKLLSSDEQWRAEEDLAERKKLLGQAKKIGNTMLGGNDSILGGQFKRCGQNFQSSPFLVLASDSLSTTPVFFKSATGSCGLAAAWLLRQVWIHRKARLLKYVLRLHVRRNWCPGLVELPQRDQIPSCPPRICRK
jgi:hypothetical protein